MNYIPVGFPLGRSMTQFDVNKGYPQIPYIAQMLIRLLVHDTIWRSIPQSYHIMWYKLDMASVYITGQYVYRTPEVAQY